MRRPGMGGKSSDPETRALWWNDRLPECHWSDKLWGHAIRSTEFVKLAEFDRVWDDPALADLIKMGASDWKAPNKMQGPTIEALRHSAAIGSRLANRSILLETKVGIPVFLPNDRD